MGRLVQRCESLTEQEYFWEPVAGCWNVRANGSGFRADPAEGSRMQVDPPPLTTIAWRLWHLGASPESSWIDADDGVVTGRQYADWWFGGKHESTSAMGSPAEALTEIDRRWNHFAAMVRGFGEDDLTEVIGPIGHGFKDATVLALVLHAVDELIHHAAEVGVLRDLYRVRD